MLPLETIRRWLAKVGLPLALTLAGVLALDRAIGRHEGGGPYRQEIPRPIAEVRRAPTARHIVVGCSTSNWFAKALRSGFQLGRKDVVDAHMSDCLQGCTMAEARQLQALGRHFETATFGVNSFEYCEAYRERRSMQEVELMPIEHSLDLARVYIHSDDPLRYVGGWLMNHASLVYGNTMWLQRHARKRWLGNESLDGRWFRRESPPKGPRRESFQCDYAAADRDFGKAATRGALRALSALADRVQLVILPDKQHSADNDEARRTRELFAREHRELVAEFERVELIDLLDPALTRQQLFRDGAHFNAKGVKLASDHLVRRVRRPPEPPRAEQAPVEPPAPAREASPPDAGDPSPDVEAAAPLDVEAAAPLDVEAGHGSSCAAEGCPVSFTTISFLAFCVLFFSGHALLRGRARSYFLLLASCYFYGSWDVRFLLLLLGSVVIDYSVALALAKSEGRRRRWLLGISLAFNLGVLAFFKYAGFFVESAAELLAQLGWPVPARDLGIVLPVGISFYTFQTLSYTVDVYRRRLEPCRDLVDFALFVMFFPQLVAGPIERAERLLPQMAGISRQPWRPDGSGLVLIALGLFKKLALADGVHAYTHPLSAPDAAYSAAIWFATLAFAFQIYWDFSAYSDIAIGLARLLGVELMSNFRAPYAATGPSDFWRRWHISLSEWLRDYLYVPLGGNRGSAARTYRNLMLTMLLGGLWHGAAWHFVLWGTYHGVLLVAARALRERFSFALPRWARPLQIVGFFYLTCLGWALFRAPTLAACVGAWRKLLLLDGVDAGAWLAHLARLGELRPVLLWCGVFAAAWLQQVVFPESSKELASRVSGWPALPRAVAVAGLAYVAMLLSPLDPPDFIYFRF